MRFVIFDDESLEPITVVNLTGFAERDIWEKMNGIVRLPVSQPASYDPFSKSMMTHLSFVELRFERFARRDQISLMAFTRETELAMLLDPDFLPGQRAYVSDLRKHISRLETLLSVVLSGR